MNQWNTRFYTYLFWVNISHLLAEPVAKVAPSEAELPSGCHTRYQKHSDLFLVILSSSISLLSWLVFWTWISSFSFSLMMPLLYRCEATVFASISRLNAILCFLSNCRCSSCILLILPTNRSLSSKRNNEGNGGWGLLFRHAYRPSPQPANLVTSWSKRSAT